MDSINIINGLLMDNNKNYSEEVKVPSSEHVAEIVGRQGCKIKSLRAKTNTYIKTPEKDMAPVFVITGRAEDVNSAKAEIISAAEHFTNIRATRRTNGTSGPPHDIPGQVTLKVPVPYRVVGLVVGSKGATIKRIQQSTNTHIMTPSREKDPVFEVTGLPENVIKAQVLMYEHIKARTGTAGCDGGPSGPNNVINPLVDIGVREESMKAVLDDPSPKGLGLGSGASSSTAFWESTMLNRSVLDMSSLSAALLDYDRPLFSSFEHQQHPLHHIAGDNFHKMSNGSVSADSLNSISGGSSSESSPTINSNLNAYFMNINRCCWACNAMDTRAQPQTLDCGHMLCVECASKPCQLCSNRWQ